MNDNRTFKFFTWFLIVVILCYLAFAGLGPVNARIIKGANDLKQVSISEAASVPLGYLIMIKSADHRAVISQEIWRLQQPSSRIVWMLRVSSINPSISTQPMAVLSYIPWAQNEAEFNPRKALDELVKPAGLPSARVLPEMKESPMTRSARQARILSGRM
jgi:hypothetical protein